MTRNSTIDAIRTLNPTASPEFLAEFSSDELTQYLQRLNRVSPEMPTRDLDDTPPPSPAAPLAPDAPTHVS